ncbi:MAG: SIS domain-containing protein [Actinomycetia bacterium]|nr:SIS domain-containing protein [Actinomycetes bacterium]
MYKTHTYKEINEQIDSFKKEYNTIVLEKDDISLDIFNDKDREIIFTGCGSSYNLTMSAAFFTKKFSKFRTEAVPSSELFYNTDIYIKKDRKYLVICFSRSGETTEVINVLQKIRSFKNVETFAFSCRSQSTLINIPDNYYICKEAEEKGIVMTKSFSSMLLAYCLMFSKFLDKKNILEDFELMIDYLDKKSKSLFTDLEEYFSRNDFNRYFALGDGFNYGLCVEADLKTKEMTQIPSDSYHVMEFNHGPKSLIDSGGLFLFLTPDKYINGLESIMRSYLSAGAKIILVGNNSLVKKMKGEIKSIFSDEQIKESLVKSFLNIPVFQVIAYVKTIKMGLNPDKPRNLDFTTKIELDY